MIDFKFGYINYLFLSKSLEFSYLKYPRHVNVKKEKYLLIIIGSFVRASVNPMEMIKFIYREILHYDYWYWLLKSLYELGIGLNNLSIRIHSISIVSIALSYRFICF